MHTRLLSIVPLTLSTIACLGPNPLIDGDDELGIIEDGVLWCTQTPDPIAYFENSQIGIWENQTGPAPLIDPTGCHCAHAELDNFLSDYIQGGEVQITTSVQDTWEMDSGEGQGPLTFRADLYAAAEERCAELADENFPERVSDSCTVVIDKVEPTVTPVWRDGESCPAGLAYGEDEEMHSLPSDSWSDYFTLNTAITYNSGTNVYTINGAFLNSMLETPAWLIEDGVYIEHNGTNYQFYDVTSGTVAYALGIQSGDIPQTLNDIDISTIAGAFEAWARLTTETEFELVILRGSNLVTLEYEVAYTLL